MTRNAVLALAVLSFAAASAPRASAAEGSAVESVKQWFRHWKLALKRSAVESRYRRVGTTAVAAVRGAGQDSEDPYRPYWKGTWSAKKEAERLAERKELESAVDLLLEGKADEASAALAAFEKAHPKSSLLEDVRLAKAKAAELKASEPKPEAAPAPEPAPAAAAAPAAEPAKSEPAKAPEAAKPAEPAKSETPQPSQPEAKP